MKTACTYSVTNSANATVAILATPGLVYGCGISGGPGTLNLYDGTTLVLSLALPTATCANNITPLLPIAFRTNISLTCSGTGVCSVFWALNT